MISQDLPAPVQGMTQQAPEMRNPGQGELQVNCWSSPVYGLGKRNGTDHIKFLPVEARGGNVFVFWWDRDVGERYLVYSYSVDNESPTLKVFDLAGTEYPVFADDFLPEDQINSLDYLRCPSPYKDLRGLALIDTVLITNRTINVEMNPNRLTATGTPQAVVWIKQGNYDQTYGVRLSGTAGPVSIKAGDGTTNGAEEVGTGLLASTLKAAIDAVDAGEYTFTYQSGDSYFVIEKADGSDFTIEGFDSMGGSGIGVVKDRVSSFDELPPVAPDEMIVRVSGGDDAKDDYWVQFDADREGGFTGAKKGYWVECPAPGIPYRINRSTLPHELERFEDDAAGTVTGTPFQIYFKWSVMRSGDREVGDEETNPDPSFVGYPIQNMFLFQNRLGLLSRDNVILSKVNDYYTWFRTTTTAVLDDDRLDIKAVTGELVDLFHAVPVFEELYLVGERAQMSLLANEALTAATARFVPATNLEADRDCPPAVAEDMVFLPYQTGSHANTREVRAQGASRLKVPDPISAHVPQLMYGKPRLMSTCPAERVLFTTTDDSFGDLYLYQWLTSNEDRVQKAWHLWTFHERVLSHHVFDSTLYLLIHRPEGVALELLELEPFRHNQDTAFVLHLDRKVPLTVGAVNPPGPGDDDDPEDPEDPVPPSPTWTARPLNTGRIRVVKEETNVGIRSDQLGADLGSTTRRFDEWRSEPPIETYPSGLVTIAKLLGTAGVVTGEVLEAGQLSKLSRGVEPTNTINDGDATPGASYAYMAEGVSQDVAIAEYFPDDDETMIRLPWKRTNGTVIVRADTMQQLTWLPGPDDYIISIQGNVTGLRLWAGLSYEARYRFSPASLLTQTPTGGLAVRQQGRLQLLKWRTTSEYSGPYDLEVRHRGRTPRGVRQTPRVLGYTSTTAAANYPEEYDGSIGILGRAQDVRVDLVARNYWPVWITAAQWEGEYEANARRK